MPLFAAAALTACSTDLAAQTFSVLHAFSGASDGGEPQSGLLLSSDTLYGTTTSGGLNHSGTVFSIKADGSDFTVIHAISDASEGLGPSRLIRSGETFFATSRQGGTDYDGTVFSFVIGDDRFVTLHSFNGVDGMTPQAELVLGGDTLYGTTMFGGTNNSGVVFSIKTNGSDFKVIHELSALRYGVATNRDGAAPQAGLLLSGNVLYGTAKDGGTNGGGTVFCVEADGSDFRTLHHFAGEIEGDSPQAGLVISGNALYGTTSGGGTNGTGTVFSLNTNGTGFTVLHAFGPIKYTGLATNVDGAYPTGTLVVAGDALFGTTYVGGAHQDGTVFLVKTDGTGFEVLHHFIGGEDGYYALSGLTFSGNTLYGVAGHGGSDGYGTVFSLAIVPGIRSLSLAATDLVVQVTNGLLGHSYTLLTSTNAALPVWQWTPVATRVLTASGNFTIAATNAVESVAPCRFYSLLVE